MLVNLWSTPRTGSTWYSSFLYNQLREKRSRTFLIKQYLNKFHFTNYVFPNFSDYIYEYRDGASYLKYDFDHLTKSLRQRPVWDKRHLDPNSEENYRVNLLEKIDCVKNNLVFHNHIEPMSQMSYNVLFNKADQNIFLYRENVIDQLSSYAIGYYTQNYHKPNNTLSNVFVEENVLKYLADRIISWHRLDKSKGLVIKYEDIPFSNASYKNLPKKQNTKKAFEALSKETQDTVLKLNEFVKNSI